MNWRALKNVDCPNCIEPLKVPLLSGFYECPLCTFKISEEKFDAIVNKLYKPRQYTTPEDNLSALNNFGHKKISEDYSDERP